MTAVSSGDEKHPVNPEHLIEALDMVAWELAGSLEESDDDD